MNHRTTAFALAALLLAGSAWAHHNMSALFDFKDRVTLTGTLTKMDWRNPHIFVYVDAKMGDKRATLVDRGTATQLLPHSRYQQGRRGTGDRQGRNGGGQPCPRRSNAGLLRTLNLPDGKVVSACPQNC